MGLMHLRNRFPRACARGYALTPLRRLQVRLTMKIDHIRIEGFGVWNDRTWGPLAPGLNVFHGANEAGKSTLMGFVRAILFGFDRRGSPRRYEPLNGGSHGGWLDLTVHDRRVRVERKSSRHVRGAVTTYEGDSTGGEQELESLLAGTTRTLYHNVFAFGLEELEQFHTLQDNEVARHISGAALGVGAARWASVQRDLETRQSGLFLPRGHSSAINVSLKELETVRDDLDRTEHQPEEYWAAHESRTRLAGEIDGLEELVKNLKQRVTLYERRLKSRPLLERRKAIEFQLASLPIIDAFPEGGVERLEMTRNQRRATESELDRLRRENERRRLQRNKLQSAADPAEQERRARAIEVLRDLIPRADAARRVLASSIERSQAIAHEKATLDTVLENVRSPSQPSFLIFIGLLWSGAAAFVWTGQSYVAAGLLTVSLAALLWRRHRLRLLCDLERQGRACADRLGGCAREVKSLETEIHQLEGEIRRLNGKTEISPQDIEARAIELERYSKAVEELRRLDDDIERAEADMLRLSRQMEERQSEISALLAETSAATEQEFVERAQIYKQRQQLINELERIPAEPPEPGLLFDIRVNEGEAYESARQELAAAEQRLVDVRHESGRVDERIAIMERSEERSRALAKQERILAKIDEDAESWAVVTLCRTLLDETRKIYETERQPEVLREASSFFKVMTEARYPRVIAPLDGAEIQVERADGVRLSPQLLSRGTAEQLYLAMRLALVRNYARRLDPLPIVFDDIFVNFDPERARNTIRAVVELAATHQILLFTCHPHLVKLVDEIIPTAAVFPLQS